MSRNKCRKMTICFALSKRVIDPDVSKNGRERVSDPDKSINGPVCDRFNRPSSDT